jgi:hypothetical protein
VEEKLSGRSKGQVGASPQAINKEESWKGMEHSGLVGGEFNVQRNVVKTLNADGLVGSTRYSRHRSHNGAALPPS